MGQEPPREGHSHELPDRSVSPVGRVRDQAPRRDHARRRRVPTAAHRSGADTVLELARAIEDVGYDEIALFEHVTVGHPIPGRSETRQAAPGAAGAPGDAWRDLVSYAADRARHRGALVLPQRQPALVAKQVATLDVLSGVGCGWGSASAGSARSTNRSECRSRSAAAGSTRRSP